MSEKSKKNKSTAGGAKADAYRFGEFSLYPSERRLERRERPVALSPKVFDALLMFVKNAEHLVRRDELIETLWPDTYVTDANLTNVIVNLRKTLGRNAIQTVSKFGYRFCLPVLGEPGVDQGMYATFVQAKELARHRSIESMARARDLFALCVAKDPQFAAAWAWLGRCHRFLDKFNAASPSTLELAEATLKRALSIDPNLACAHHFYTQLQVDLGQSQDVIVRLARRLREAASRKVLRDWSRPCVSAACSTNRSSPTHAPRHSIPRSSRAFPTHISFVASTRRRLKATPTRGTTSTQHHGWLSATQNGPSSSCQNGFATRNFLR
jgi:hypothetical protein